MAWLRKRSGVRRANSHTNNSTNTRYFKFQALLLEDRAVPSTLSVGPVENVSRLPGNQSEASIAINPTNPSNLIAVSNSSADNGIVVYRSVNAGGTWSSQVIGPGPLGNNPCCDSEVAFDSFGNLFLVYLDFGLAGSTANVLLSTNGGQGFLLLGSVINDFSLDQPTIAVGPGPTAATRSVWVSTKTSSGLQTTGATISGLGAVSPFSSPTAVPFTIGGNFGNVAVGPGGEVVVTYQQPTGGAGPSQIFTALDPDGVGPLPFNNPVLATDTNVGGFRPIPAQPSRTVDAEGNCVFDNSNGLHNGRLYLVYTDAADPNTDDLDIFSRFSDDGGATWSTRVRVNDDATANSQFFPGLAVDPTTGNLAIGFYDCRNSPGNNTVEYFVTVSENNGVSFLPNVAVSTGQSNGNAGVIGDPNEFGDFYTIDFYNNVVRPIWADNSANLPGNPDPSSLDIASAAVIFSNIPPPPPPPPLTGHFVASADTGGAPLVKVFDLATGALVGQFLAYSLSFAGGVRIATADFNGDGIADIVTAAGPGGGPHVRVFNGATLRPLLTPIGNFMAYNPIFTGGVFVAAGDVDGDGIPDVITGAGHGGGPHVRVFSGADGHVIREFMAYDTRFTGGVSVAAGDLNADGFDDVLTGAGPGGGPHVEAFDIHNRAILTSLMAYSLNFHGGVFVSSGDVNGDGHGDIIAGAGNGGGAHVHIFSGIDGTELGNFFAYSNTIGSNVFVGNTTYFGGVRILSKDVDGDGKADILAAPGVGGRPTVRIFRANGTQIGSQAVFDPSFIGGLFVG